MEYIEKRNYYSECKPNAKGYFGRLWKRAGAVLLAAVLAMPAQVQAQGNLYSINKAQKNTVGNLLVKAREISAQGGTASGGNGIRAERKLYHVHIGNADDGTGCYTKDILHMHEGDPGGGGACYKEPIYHEHTGNEEEGGGCYGKKNYHVHEGNETEGGACYGEKVYHTHTGNEKEGGGCYGKKVYHTHTGSENAGGGCYSKEIKHEHTGDAVNGGGCYGKAVRHTHTGSEISGGGCYSVPVYHTHIGDSVSGGSCYMPVYHTHKEECYGTAECTAAYEGGMKIISKQDADCPLHGTAQHVTFEANFSHKNCDKKTATETRTICWICRDMGYTHEYPKAVCGMDEAVEEYTLFCGKDPETTVDAWERGCNLEEGTIIEYEINCGKDTTTVESYGINCGKDETDVDVYETDCGKTEETVEAYVQNCGKTEETVESYSRNCEKGEDHVDAYALSCGKEEESVDGHELGCGREEDVPYAVFSLSMGSSGWSSEPVLLQAVCENGDGFVRLAEKPFLWEGTQAGEGGNGSISGDGDTGNGQGVCTGSFSVTENGVYTVRLMVENEDIDDREPALSVAVNNIDRTAPQIRDIIYDTEKEVKEIEIRVEAVDIQPDGSPGSGLAVQAYSFDGGQTWVKENVCKVKENGTVEIAVRDACGNIVKENIEISNIGNGSDPDEGNKDEGDGTDKGEGDGTDKEEGDGADKGEGDGTDKEEGDGTDKGEGDGTDKEEGDGTDKEEEAGTDKEEGDDTDKEEEDGTDKEDGAGTDKGEGDGIDKGEGDSTNKEDGTDNDDDGSDKGNEDASDKEAEGNDLNKDNNDGTEDDGPDEKGETADTGEDDGKDAGEGDAGTGDGDAGTGEGSDGGNTEKGNNNSEGGSGDGTDMEDGNGDVPEITDDGAEGGESKDKLMMPVQSARKRRKPGKGGMEENAPEDGELSDTQPDAAGIDGEISPEEPMETGSRPTQKMPDGQETVTVRQPEVNTGHISGIQPETIKRGDVIVPVVKAITFTMGSVAAAAVLLYLLYMMLRSIKIYHLDGDGKSHYAGSCIMKKTGNGFEVKIPDRIIEQSATGQFVLQPGSMFVSNHKGEELIILAGERKEAVWIDKEIPLKLAVFA